MYSDVVNTDTNCHTADWYAAQDPSRFQFHIGETVTSIDTEGHRQDFTVRACYSPQHTNMRLCREATEAEVSRGAVSHDGLADAAVR